MYAEDVTDRFKRYLGPWSTADGTFANPGSPVGGGGPGRFRHAGSLSVDFDIFNPIAHPQSPSARYLAQNTPQKAANTATDATATAAPTSTGPTPPPPPAQPDLNEKLLKKAQENVDKPKVILKAYKKQAKDGRVYNIRQGDGQCNELPETILNDLGGQNEWDFTPNGDEDYRWGQKIDPGDAKPGDIVQTKGLEFKRSGTKTVTTKDATGKVIHEEKSTITEETWKLHHHTMIIERSLGNGKLIVINQHVHNSDPNRGPNVNRDTVETVSATDRTTVLSVEQKFDPFGLTEAEKTTTVTTTVKETIEVKGEVKYYRPQAKKK